MFILTGIIWKDFHAYNVKNFAVDFGHQYRASGSKPYDPLLMNRSDSVYMIGNYFRNQ